MKKGVVADSLYKVVHLMILLAFIVTTYFLFFDGLYYFEYSEIKQVLIIYGVLIGFLVGAYGEKIIYFFKRKKDNSPKNFINPFFFSNL